MNFRQRDYDVDTPCEYGHKRCFREDYAVIDGVEHLTWRRGPTCWNAGCPAHAEYLRNEQPGARGQ